jgi:tetratricopeptide (TPR) repeat protein
MIESNTNKDLESKIESYLEGELSANQIDELWAELIQDDYYYDYLKTAASIKGLSEKRKKKAPIFELSQTKQVYLAAAIMLIAAIFVVFSISDDNSNLTVNPVSSIELDYYRSAEGVVLENESNDMLMMVISIANSGDIEGSLLLINEQFANTENSYIRQELMVTAGSILYNSGNYELALEKFEKGLEYKTDNILLTERNYWYMGNTYFQLNKIDKAKEALENAYKLDGAYSRIAESYLKALAE